MYNPYIPMAMTNNQIIRVNGGEGARNFQMQPNSSALLLDTTAPLVWLSQADAFGNKTVTPYKIELYQEQTEPSLNEILERINKIEDKINAQSNSDKSESKK